jgi:hypothetical protein
MIGRRSFITGLVALVAAPAIVRAGSLMPVRQMIVPLATVDASGQIGGQLIVNGLTGSLRAGDVITIEDVGAWNRLQNTIDPRLRLFVVTANAESGDRIVNLYPPILTPKTPPKYGYGPTVSQSPRNCAEVKLVEWPPRA